MVIKLLMAAFYKILLWGFPPCPFHIVSSATIQSGRISSTGSSLKVPQKLSVSARCGVTQLELLGPAPFYQITAFEVGSQLLFGTPTYPPGAEVRGQVARVLK
jgi:hypothetical protein